MKVLERDADVKMKQVFEEVLNILKACREEAVENRWWGNSYWCWNVNLNDLISSNTAWFTTDDSKLNYHNANYHSNIRANHCLLASEKLVSQD